MNPLLGAMAGLSGLKAITQMGKNLLAGTAAQLSMGKSFQMLSSAYKDWGGHINLIPGVNIINSAARGFRGGMGGKFARGSRAAYGSVSGNWESVDGMSAHVANIKSAFSPLEDMGTGSVAGQLKKMFRVNRKESVLFDQVHQNVVKNMKSNPNLYKEQLSNMYIDAMTSNSGFSKMTVGHMKSARVAKMFPSVTPSFQKALAAQEQGQASMHLIGTKMLSNMAAVAIPTIGTNVAAFAVGRSIYNRTRNRMRGYIE